MQAHPEGRLTREEARAGTAEGGRGQEDPVQHQERLSDSQQGQPCQQVGLHQQGLQNSPQEEGQVPAVLQLQGGEDQPEDHQAQQRSGRKNEAQAPALDQADRIEGLRLHPREQCGH